MVLFFVSYKLLTFKREFIKKEELRRVYIVSVRRGEEIFQKMLGSANKLINDDLLFISVRCELKYGFYSIQYILAHGLWLIQKKKSMPSFSLAYFEYFVQKKTTLNFTLFRRRYFSWLSRAIHSTRLIIFH